MFYTEKFIREKLFLARVGRISPSCTYDIGFWRPAFYRTKLRSLSFIQKEKHFLFLTPTLCIPLSVEYIECTEMAITEFLLFVLTATLGGMFLCGANDLITIFVAPECFSLCSYLLSGYTKRDLRSNEATMKYLLMGGASSSILVHGFSWLYGSSGGEIELQEIVNGLINTQMYNSPGISIALIFITVGIGFKLSPAPSHQWTPDVYEGVRFVR